MRRRLALTIAVSLTAALTHGGTSFEEGERLYAANEPRAAQALLEEALAADPTNPKIYAYLGVIYEQLGDSERAIAILQRGLAVAGSLKPTFYFNIGNNYLRRGQLAEAEKMYGEAVALDPAYAEPLLNRANVRVTLGNYQGAIADYTVYLRLAPGSRKRAEVQRMIELLSAFLQQKESEERERKERERALVEQVMDALRNASEDAQNLSKRSDRVLEEKEEEIDIKE